jgi:hypothetical protein
MKQLYFVKFSATGWHQLADTTKGLPSNFDMSAFIQMDLKVDIKYFPQFIIDECQKWVTGRTDLHYPINVVKEIISISKL